MTALSQYEREQLARIEATPDAEESLRERVARAIWDAADGYISGVPWDRAQAHVFQEAKAYLRADAAIAVMRGEHL